MVTRNRLKIRLKTAAILFFLLACSSTGRTRDVCCDARVTIRPSNIQENGCTHAGIPEEYECSTLQTALEFLREANISGNCTEIELSSSVNHFLTKPVHVNASVLLSSSDSQVAAVVTAAISADAYFNSEGYDPLYILHIQRAQYFGMERIEMHGSPGIVGVSYVDLVEIKNCSFRLVYSKLSLTF